MFRTLFRWTRTLFWVLLGMVVGAAPCAFWGFWRWDSIRVLETGTEAAFMHTFSGGLLAATLATVFGLWCARMTLDFRGPTALAAGLTITSLILGFASALPTASWLFEADASTNVTQNLTAVAVCTAIWWVVLAVAARHVFRHRTRPLPEIQCQTEPQS